jgi:hypothetical protein
MWHFLDSESLPSSLEPVEASWEGRFLAGAPSALLKLIPTPGVYFLRGSETVSCPGSQSGTTFAPSTAGLGETASMSSAEDSPVRTSAPATPTPPASKEAEADFGNQWLGSSARFCLDSSSWKTRHGLWEEGLPWSSVTLPDWGMMRSGECWARVMSEPRSSGTASGSWVRGPMHKDGRGFYRATLEASQNRVAGGRTIHWIHQALLSSGWPIGTANPRFSEVLMAWPTSWTSLEPLETAKFQQWLRSHGEPSQPNDQHLHAAKSTQPQPSQNLIL